MNKRTIDVIYREYEITDTELMAALGLAGDYITVVDLGPSGTGRVVVTTATGPVQE